MTHVVPNNRSILTRVADAWHNRTGGGVVDRKPGMSGKSNREVKSGNGSQTVFTFPHKLGKVPTYQNVRGISSAAQASSTVTVDATQFTVTFAAAPPAGTDNLVFTWIATL